MYCPRCGTLARDEQKFCTACGVNLSLITDVLAGRVGERTTGSGRSLLEMLFGIEKRPELTPEQKRMQDIRNGVLSLFVGIGLSLFLYILLGAVAEQIGPAEARIVRTVWTCGLIPVFVGIGLIVNGLFFWKPSNPLEATDRPARDHTTVAQKSLPSGVDLTLPLSRECRETPTIPLDETPPTDPRLSA